MPVFGACFWPALFAVMQRYKDCVNEQKEMPAFIPFLASIYNVRAYIYNKQFIIPSSPSLSSFFFVFLPFPPCSYFANLRPIVQAARKFANYEAFKIPLSALVQAFALLFWLCILLLSIVPPSLVGCSDRSQRLSLPRFLVLS